jgi:IS5 family transposase
MRRVTDLVGAVGTQPRDRSQSVKLRVLEIARVARATRGTDKTRLSQTYRRLLDATSRVAGQAKRFANEIALGVKQSAHPLKQAVLSGLRQELESMVRWCAG